MKRVTSMCLVFVLLAGLLGGCKGKKEGFYIESHSVPFKANSAQGEGSIYDYYNGN